MYDVFCDVSKHSSSPEKRVEQRGHNPPRRRCRPHRHKVISVCQFVDYGPNHVGAYCLVCFMIDRDAALSVTGDQSAVSAMIPLSKGEFP